MYLIADSIEHSNVLARSYSNRLSIGGICNNCDLFPNTECFLFRKSVTVYTVNMHRGVLGVCAKSY